MPMYADGKSKKVKVGPTVEETSVKTVEVVSAAEEQVQLGVTWIRTRRA
jgi:hypothetical protein